MGQNLTSVIERRSGLLEIVLNVDERQIALARQHRHATSCTIVVRAYLGLGVATKEIDDAAICAYFKTAALKARVEQVFLIQAELLESLARGFVYLLELGNFKSVLPVYLFQLFIALQTWSHRPDLCHSLHEEVIRIFIRIFSILTRFGQLCHLID